MLSPIGDCDATPSQQVVRADRAPKPRCVLRSGLNPALLEMRGMESENSGGEGPLLLHMRIWARRAKRCLSSHLPIKNSPPAIYQSATQNPSQGKPLQFTLSILLFVFLVPVEKRCPPAVPAECPRFPPKLISRISCMPKRTVNVSVLGNVYLDVEARKLVARSQYVSARCRYFLAVQ